VRWFNRNIFSIFSDLPDEPGFGSRLMAAGFLLAGLSYGWPRLGASSFSWVSEFFLQHLDFFRHRHTPASVADFGILLWITAVMCFVSGAFIFLRRGFWWVAEHRSEREPVELKFK